MQKKSKEKAAWMTQIRADRAEWVELLGLNPSDDRLALVGISRPTWARIAAGKAPAVPIASYRLAEWQRYFHLGDVLGRAWDGFFTSGDTLALPGVKYPLQAAELRSVWLDIQALPVLRRELHDLRRQYDWVPVSPQVREWLHGLGRVPLRA